MLNHLCGSLLRLSKILIISLSGLSVTQVTNAAEIVGSIPGQFSVSPSGSATYSVPIEVPPGINGLQPSLALVYDSQSGNGLLGQGWGLSGLSSISRCSQTLEQDNIIHGVDFSDEDRLCLDGQRLVPVNGATYWNATEYRTEIESFSKVTRFGVGNGSWFKVETKDGRDAEYGNEVIPNNAKQNVTVIKTGETPVLSWAVNKISDKFGNNIFYVYDEDVLNGEHRINKIKYAGGASASVEFLYEARNDSVYNMIAGAKLNQSNRLFSINMLSEGATTSFNQYFLTYEYSSSAGRSTLQNIKKCASINTCKLETSFIWKYKESGASPATGGKLLAGDFGETGDYSKLTGDFDGNGINDLVWMYSGINGLYAYSSLGNGNGIFATPVGGQLHGGSFFGVVTDYSKFTGDFNGDGLTDLVWVYSAASGLHAYSSLSNGDGTFLPATGGVLHTSSFGDAYSRVTGDFDGDGRTDLAWMYSGSNGLYAYSSLGNGDGTFSVATGGQLLTGSFGNTYSRTTGDFNGDGLTDLAWMYSGASGLHAYTSLGNGDGTFSAATGGKLLAGKFGDTYARITGDFNGDGVTDLAWTYSGSGGLHAYSALGNGDGSFEDAVGGQVLTGSFGAANTYSKTTGDFNSDGLTDLAWVYSGTSGLHAYSSLSNGDGTFTVATGGQLLPGSFGNAYSKLTGDFNGDGVTDLAWMYSGVSGLHAYTSLSSNINNIGAESLANIKNNDVLTNIKYEFLTNNSIYTKDKSGDLIENPIGPNYIYEPEYPITDIQAPIQVVSSVSTDNGLGGQNTTTYKYGGMKVHQRGLGSLGFRWMESTDQYTGIKNTTEYYQQYPYIGAVKHSETVAYEGTLDEVILNSSDTSYTYNGFACLRYPVTGWLLPDCLTSSPGILFAYPDSTSSTQRDLNGALIKTVATATTQNNFVDNFVGDTTSTVTTTGPTGLTYQQVTSSTYANNASTIYSEKDQLTQTQVHAVDNAVASETVTKAFTYNPEGRLLTDTLEPGSLTDELTKTYGYDGFGNRTTVSVSGVNVVTRTSSTVFDINGLFPKTITNALGHSESRVYDPRFGVMTSRTGPNGLTTTYEYDNFGRKTAQITARGNRSEVTRKWCDINLDVCTIPAITPDYSAQSVSYIVTSGTKGLDTVAFVPPLKTYFDKFSREVRRESVGFDGSLIYIDTNYDALGRVVAKTQPYFSTAIADKNPTRLEYDLLGRTTHEFTPAGTDVETLYNGLVLTTHAHIQNPVRTETKIETGNAIGQLLSVLDNALNTVSFAYNPQGKRTHTTDPAGNVVVINYDKLGRKTNMTDPEMGAWSYTYNALGELTSQKDAMLQVTSMQYDLLGRMAKRTDHDGLVSEWRYNDNLNAGNIPRNKAIGKLDSVTSSNGYAQELYYGNLGEPDYNTVTIAGSGAAHRTDTTYDAYGRLDTVIYPQSIGRFAVRHHYQNGLLKKVSSTDNLTNYWEAMSRDAKSQIARDRLGSHLELSRTFDAVGRASWINAAYSADFSNPFNRTTIYDAQYAFDSIGNLTQRISQRNQGNQAIMEENYTYDSLNRLTHTSILGVGEFDTTYDLAGLGNIQSKTGVGSYTYDINKPHAVKTANGYTYNYDANGNMIDGGGRTVNWTSHNKPSRITKGVANSSFLYGPSRQRFYHQQSNGTAAQNKETYYISGIFEKEIKGGVAEFKHYIRAGGKTIAEHKRKAATADVTNYLIRDYQNSVVTITDAAGTVTGHMDFDAYGSRRPILGLSQLDQIISSFSRGYTGHEHLDNVGLIHMNGRVYEPTLGRFLSADPVVQAPDNLQSLNRYAYVFNNPMSYTDPSGFRSWRKKLRRIGNLHKKVFNAYKEGNRRLTGHAFHALFKVSPIARSGKVRKMFRDHHHAAKIGGVIAAVADGLGCMGACSAGFSAYVTEISGGSIEDMGRGAINSYASYLAFNAVNSPGRAWGWGRVIDNGLVGGAAAKANGGNFGDGFKMSAGISALTWAATAMRQDQIASSELYQPGEGKMSNSSGKSVGFNGDGFKLGGGRCSSTGCGFSLLGGQQGGEGSLLWFDYNPGSAADYLVEAFAGPHDYLNSGFWYDSVGNAIDYGLPMTIIGESLNAVNVLVASPIVLASVTQPYTSSLIHSRYNY